MFTEDHVSVAIVGGGVAGLALASILEQSAISFVLLEAHSRIAPPAGASIGLMPNGLRILDQIGVIDELEEHMCPHDKWEHRDGNGTLYCTLTAMRKYPELLGYSGFFMERQRLLEILYENIQDKTKIHTGKRVSSIQNFDTHALVTTADGTQITCDFVAGADGVHSVVRREIEAATPGLELPADYFAANYACVYGISDPLPALPAGRIQTIYQSSASALLFSGRNGVLYWFVMTALAHPLAPGAAPRYTAPDIAAATAQVARVALAADGGSTTTFSHVYAARRTAVMTPLEEGVAVRWTHARAALLGDAAHKMVPHAAMGANQALESAACFANALFELRGALGGLPPRGVPSRLVGARLAAYERRRRGRVTEVVRGAGFACRAQLKVGEQERRYVEALPGLRDEVWLGKVLESLFEAEKLEGWEADSERVRYYSSQQARRKGGESLASI